MSCVQIAPRCEMAMASCAERIVLSGGWNPDTSEMFGDVFVADLSGIGCIRDWVTRVSVQAHLFQSTMTRVRSVNGALPLNSNWRHIPPCRGHTLTFADSLMEKKSFLVGFGGVLDGSAQTVSCDTILTHYTLIFNPWAIRCVSRSTP